MVKSDYDLSISNILQSVILEYLVALVCIFLQLKELNLRCVVLFSYIIERLNLSDFIMNLIEDFDILQFCWN